MILTRQNTGLTLYAIINHPTSWQQVWDYAASVPGWVLFTTGNWADFAIPLTEDPAGGYRYHASIPSEITTSGTLRVDIFQQAGGSPAITDTLLETQYIPWDGSAVVSEARLSSIESTLGNVETDVTDILADTNELQAAFANVDSTSTETITGAKALEIILALLGGNAVYNVASRTLTVYGRDGTTALWTVKISNTTAGTRTDSTKV